MISFVLCSYDHYLILRSPNFQGTPQLLVSHVPSCFALANGWPLSCGGNELADCSALRGCTPLHLLHQLHEAFLASNDRKKELCSSSSSMLLLLHWNSIAQRFCRYNLHKLALDPSRAVKWSRSLRTSYCNPCRCIRK